MLKSVCVILCVCTLALCPMDMVFAQDELPFDPFIDNQLHMQGRSGESRAIRDLGGVKMDTVVGVPSEVKNDIRVTRKISAKGEKPIIILVYGRKETVSRESADSEELQRKEVERMAFKEGLRGENYTMTAEIRHDKAEAAQVVK